MPPLGCERASDFASDAAARSRDQCHLSSEASFVVRGHFLLLLVLLRILPFRRIEFVKREPSPEPFIPTFHFEIRDIDIRFATGNIRSLKERSVRVRDRPK